jgi:hypothetical protein
VVVSTAADAETIQLGTGGNAVEIAKAAKTVTVEKPVTVTITLPEGFATDGDTLYITHVKNEVTYLYTGKVESTDDGLVLTFENPHGFSTFTITGKAPDITIDHGEAGTQVYETLAAAVADVKNGETITYTGTNETPITVSKEISFTVTAGTPNIVAGRGYTLTTKTGENGTTYTITTAKESGGSGGGSSTASYAITVAAADGGKVTASAAKAPKGTEVTLTVTADEGKALDTLTVTGASGNKITVTKNADGTYTFAMPESTVTVTAAFKDTEKTEEPKEPAEENCPSEKFTDVNTGLWYHEAVDYVLEKGIMEGNGNGTFTPNANLTRGQLAQILYNAAGKPEVTAENPFTDVPETQWYAKAVIWAAQAGVVEGYGNGKFGPKDKISRQDLAVMLWRYAGKPEATQTSLDFTDADKVSDYAEEALLWANEVGIVQGDKGVLNPKGSATRAEAATMIMRYLELG